MSNFPPPKFHPPNAHHVFHIVPVTSSTNTHHTNKHKPSQTIATNIKSANLLPHSPSPHHQSKTVNFLPFPAFQGRPEMPSAASAKEGLPLIPVPSPLPSSV